MSDPAAHPEHAAEQAYIDHAYQRLDQIREQAIDRAAKHAREKATTFSQVYDRDVSVRVALHRAETLDIGDESIIFGRTDSTEGDRYYIGRRAVFGEHHEPLVVDWRVPAAEPFYRATGFESLGLALRRHFLCESRKLLAIEDEHFGDGTDLGLAGSGALLAALERPRTGTMRDIAATIRAEQDVIIRAPLEGVLAVQGGPGTGKTAVALHRAAFLLFTHRKKLGQQGILVVGPNRLFLHYIERVLPALGESGARLVILEDLVPGVRTQSGDPPPLARIKGEERMASVIERAIANRQKHPSGPLTLTWEDYELRLSTREIEGVISSARRVRRTHNATHAALRRSLAKHLYDHYHRAVVKQYGSFDEMNGVARRPGEAALRSRPEVAALLEDLWPLLSPKRFLSELLASRPALQAAGLSEADAQVLWRSDGGAWTHSDIPLLDEAAALLGAAVENRSAADDGDLDEWETYGHVVVDEVQDLTPMALRMVARRARHGSMTMVGDLAQSVGAMPPESWDQILSSMSTGRGAAVQELTINYRTPGSVMDVAARVLAVAAPDLVPPTSIRDDGEPLAFVETTDLIAELARAATTHRSSGLGTLAIIAPESMLPAIRDASGASDNIEASVSALSVEDAKGLEFDEVIVAEPSQIVAESPQGLRALYVALTRATRHAAVVHAQPLPVPLTKTR